MQILTTRRDVISGVSSHPDVETPVYRVSFPGCPLSAFFISIYTFRTSFRGCSDAINRVSTIPFNISYHPDMPDNGVLFLKKTNLN